jgi:hypothetical protein
MDATVLKIKIRPTSAFGPDIPFFHHSIIPWAIFPYKPSLREEVKALPLAQDFLLGHPQAAGMPVSFIRLN